ncbi:hypothetical protein [Vibrio campbellii]|uniref:hypothetical protein n=1 Tax=Vibrio campbellii TaxID=680 RepID=UPI00210D2E04|nr:hypothetical protein [Vibrio campbellii]UTZ44636.1 hypothetical protein HB764_25580 [Vibrio campbellii]
MEAVAKKLNAIPIIDGTENGYSDVVNEVKNFDQAFFVNGGIKLIDEAGKEIPAKPRPRWRPYRPR